MANEENNGVRIHKDDINYLKKIIERNRSNSLLAVIGTMGVLLIILTVCAIYLCFKVSKGSVGVASNHAVLILSIESDIQTEELSDSDQVLNALNRGGMIRIGSDIESMEYSLGTSFWSYGARNTDGEVWTYGAILNYISNQGWNLVQVTYASQPTVQYYFTR